MLDYHRLHAFRFQEVRQTYTSRDSILYALGVGFGADPLDRRELPFVFEKQQAAMPTMASVLASPGFWMQDHPEFGIDVLRIVHGEQNVTLHDTLPAAGTVIGRMRVLRIVDKGEGKGAVLQTEKKLFDAATEGLIATVEQTVFCRGDGGFSKHHGETDAPAPPLAAAPDALPEHCVDLPIRADAALLYRLSGDLNPLHADPDVAGRAGFPRPILHGLATFGIAGRALLATFCHHDPRQLTSLRARMSSPVYPGETLRVECWTRATAAGPGVAFRARVVERDVVVLSHGHADIASD